MTHHPRVCDHLT